MFITCPACSTQFQVSSAAFGPRPRRVRCSSCGHDWNQDPKGDPAPRESRESRARTAVAQRLMAVGAAARAAEPAPRARPKPRPKPVAKPAPVPKAAPKPQPKPQPKPKPKPAPAPMPEPEPEPELVQADMAEPAPAPMAEPEPAPEPAATSAEPEETLSDEELDAMLGPETDIEPMTSLVDHPEDDDLGPQDPDDIPEPEPIPEVFTASDIGAPRRERRSGLGKLIGLLVGLIVVILIAGLFFGRTYIASVWPPAAAYYEMIGLSAETIGADLDIRNVRSERGNEGGADALIVHGVIANTAKAARPVPNIRIALFDAANDVVQMLVLAPQAPEVAADGEQPFRAVVAKPSPLARRLEVTFTKDPPTAP